MEFFNECYEEVRFFWYLGGYDLEDYSQCKYSILINRTREGFFSSSHGLKQGDPLSPSLFIIGSELLSTMLNNLNSDENFTPFSMNYNGRIINHLAYADDIVIFRGGNNNMIKLIKHQIRRYEKASGQKVNNDEIFHNHSKYFSS